MVDSKLRKVLAPFVSRKPRKELIKEARKQSIKKLKERELSLIKQNTVLLGSILPIGATGSLGAITRIPQVIPIGAGILPILTRMGKVEEEIDIVQKELAKRRLKKRKLLGKKMVRRKLKKVI